MMDIAEFCGKPFSACQVSIVYCVIAFRGSSAESVKTNAKRAAAVAARVGLQATIFLLYSTLRIVSVIVTKILSDRWYRLGPLVPVLRSTSVGTGHGESQTISEGCGCSP